jgi:hypothetical protein
MTPPAVDSAILVDLCGETLIGEKAVPRVPERAHLPLLPSSPGGVGRVIATRGTREEVYSDRLGADESGSLSRSTP